MIRYINIDYDSIIDCSIFCESISYYADHFKGLPCRNVSVYPLPLHPMPFDQDVIIEFNRFTQEYDPSLCTYVIRNINKKLMYLVACQYGLKNTDITEHNDDTEDN